MKITNNVKILFFLNKCPWSYKKFLQYNIPSVLDENKELYLSMRHVNLLKELRQKFWGFIEAIVNL